MLSKKITYCQKQKYNKLGAYDAYCNKAVNHPGRHWYMKFIWWENKGLSTSEGRLIKKVRA